MKIKPIRSFHPLHQVISETGLNAVSSRYIGPLLGNGELCLLLDENGVMHDYAPLPGRTVPRIHWAGRRLRAQNRPIVPFGYFTALPSWEWLESKRWSQTLEPRTGIVTTIHERGAPVEPSSRVSTGSGPNQDTRDAYPTAQMNGRDARSTKAIGREQTETLLLLDRNLIAIHKKIEKLRGAAALEFRYRLCAAGGLGLPEGITLKGSSTAEAWLDYELSGVVTHLGRIALWSDKPGTAEVQGNELRLRIPLNAAADEVTVYLAFADDLGDEMFYKHTSWAGRYADHPRLAPVLRALHDRPVTKGDPLATIRTLQDWTRKEGWAGVRQHQVQCWTQFFQPGWLDLPDAPEVQAIWETGMYATRTQLTRWSIPVMISTYFNAQYFWDCMAGVKALLQAGHAPLVERIADHQLSVLPLGMQMVDGVGARQEQPSFEGGHLVIGPAGCSLYEVHANGTPPRLVWAWLLYGGMDRPALERYYPIFWGAAEFFRNWMIYQGPDGKYFTGACVDVNEFIPAVRNGAATVVAARGCLDLAANVAERLGRDPELVKTWREIAAGLSRDARTNKRGLLASFDGDEGVSFTPLGWAASAFTNGWLRPDDPRVRRTLEAFLKECKSRENWATTCSPAAKLMGDVNDPDHCVWTWLGAWAVEVAALIRDGELAAQTVAELVRCANNFGSLYEAKVMRDGFISAPWFVTSSCELSAGIMMLFAQDDGQQIELLPAIPAAWKNLSFQLAVTNRTTVRVEVKDGVLRELKLTGPAEPRQVRIPARFNPAALLGKPRREDAAGPVFEITPT